MNGQFKKGDVVKVVREPFYTLNGRKIPSSEVGVGDFLTVTSKVDEDGDVDVARINDGDEGSVSTECIELVDSPTGDLVVTDSRILEKMDDIRKIAKGYTSKQFYPVSTSSMSSTKMSPADMEAHLFMFFLDALATFKEDSDGTI